MPREFKDPAQVLTVATGERSPEIWEVSALPLEDFHAFKAAVESIGQPVAGLARAAKTSKGVLGEAD
jgi:hypothetical protein